jgi:hypothetical protein
MLFIGEKLLQNMAYEPAACQDTWMIFIRNFEEEGAEL